MSAAKTDRIHTVVSQVFGVSSDDISDASSPDTIPGWNSLAHLNLVLALEAEFGVALSPEDTMEMLSVGLIRHILIDHGVAFGDG